MKRVLTARDLIFAWIKSGLWSVAVMAGFLAGFAWLVLRPHEPIYQGRPLSYWINEAYYNGDLSQGSGSRAESALVEMGTNALPALIRMAGVRMSGWRVLWGQTMGASLAQMSSDPQFAFLHLPLVHPEVKQQSAFWGFRLLGAKAAPAVPALARWLNDDEDSVRADAAICLAQIGPAAQEAVPVLSAAIQDRTRKTGPDHNLRKLACYALGQIGPGASSAVPQLTAALNAPEQDVAIVAEWALMRINGSSPLPFIDRLKDTSNLTNWNETTWLVGSLGTNAEPAIPLLLSVLGDRDTRIQNRAIGTLGAIHGRPEVCIPALVPFLKATNVNVRQNAMWTLRAFGSAAKPAIPEIIGCLNDSDPWVQRQATNALRRLDPEAASRAGVK